MLSYHWFFQASSDGAAREGRELEGVDGEQRNVATAKKQCYDWYHCTISTERSRFLENVRPRRRNNLFFFFLIYIRRIKRKSVLWIQCDQDAVNTIISLVRLSLFDHLNVNSSFLIYPSIIYQREAIHNRGCLSWINSYVPHDLNLIPWAGSATR